MKNFNKEWENPSNVEGKIKVFGSKVSMKYMYDLKKKKYN